MAADQHWEQVRFGNKDVYYQVVSQEEREERLRAQSRGKKRGVTARSIKNPHYVDATPSEVADRLRERQDGDFLFSPEVRSGDHVKGCWVDPGVHVAMMWSWRRP